MTASLFRAITTAAVAAVLGTLGLPHDCRAQVAQGTAWAVFKVDNGRVYINAGSEDSVRVGMTVTFCEAVSSTDQSGASLADLIPVAEGKVKFLGKHTSVVATDSSNLGSIRIGTPVSLPISAWRSVKQNVEVNTAPPHSSEGEPRQSMLSPQDTALLHTSATPTRATQAADQPTGRGQSFDPKAHGLMHTIPANATMFATLPVTVYAPQPMSAPKLYYRVSGKIEYKEVDLALKSNDFYVYEIPKEQVAEPAIEYYITVLSPSGEEILAVGNPETPISIPISGFLINPDLELARHHGKRNVLRVIAERAAFRENDSYEHYEADYLYRVFTVLYSIRMGMGAFRGQGFTDLSPQSPVQSHYYYGYTEAELKFPHSAISFIARILTGINDNGIGNGVETKIRFGDELGVNLLAAVWSTSKLGTSTTVQLNVPLTPRFGFSGNIAVEDLPSAGPTGFRMAVDVQYELVNDLDVIGRVGVGARKTDFLGSNFGLGLVREF